MARHLSQPDLARDLLISRSALAAIEEDRTHPPPDVVCALEGLLGVEVDRDRFARRLADLPPWEDAAPHERVQRLRLEKKWTREHLAERAGIHRDTLRRVERGQITQPSTRDFVAGALGTTWDNICKRS